MEPAPHRLVTFSMSASVDGFVEDTDGGFDWGAPEPEVFAAHLDELRGTGVHLLGRRLYEVMRYWEGREEDQELDDAEREWARLWNALPKVVFSRTLTEVGPDARLATADLAGELARLQAEPDGSEIAVGGADLAAQAAALGLLDEYRVFVYPVAVGGGTPYWPAQAGQLERVDTWEFGCGVVRHRYRPGRPSASPG